MQVAREIWEQWRIPLGMLLAYWLLAGLVVRFVHRRWCSKRRATNPRRYRWVFALVLAVIFTPSIISDFFLFMIPGPAILGLLLLVPAMFSNLLSGPYISFAIFVTTFIYHVLPMALGFALAYWLLGRQEHPDLPHAAPTV